VILEAFAFLLAGPVGKESELPVDHRYGDEHIAGNAECGDATEQSDQQAEATEEFGTNGQDRDWRWNAQLMREKSHSAGKAIATEPTQNLLSTMSEKDDTKRQPKDEDGEIVSGGHELANHGTFPPLWGEGTTIGSCLGDWFLNRLEELGIECQAGDAAKIRAAEPRKQKHDRRDAELLLKLLVENRCPALQGTAGSASRVLHRHHWVRLRTQIRNALQAMALANGLLRGPGLWSYDCQIKIAFLPMPPCASYRRSALQTMDRKMQEEIEDLTGQVAEQALGHNSLG